jgi:hypothetical protein
VTGPVAEVNIVPEPEMNPEVKITPEPNIVPVIGETIYGWTLYMSAKYNQPFWSRKTSSKTFWEDPPEIVIRKKILDLESNNENFLSGNSVYYLGGDMNDPNLRLCVWYRHICEYRLSEKLFKKYNPQDSICIGGHGDYRMINNQNIKRNNEKMRGGGNMK